MIGGARKTAVLLFVLGAITTFYFITFYIFFLEARMCGDVEISSNWLSGLFRSCFG
jgi:hypothetical protein